MHLLVDGLMENTSSYDTNISQKRRRRMINIKHENNNENVREGML
jgi:hypothetical protein